MSLPLYRKDIDGLRTLAVLPVVFFHVGVPGFYGGFVGVDIFFVISGYLITGIIFRELQDNSFSIFRFYRRRILRIFPALFVMLLAVASIAYQAFMPSELAAFGRSMVSTGLFYSNIEFFQQAGYFGPSSHDLPLLHTWSLAVEEQFYIVWPVLLLLAANGGKSRTVGLTIAATVCSFIASVWWLPRNPDATFYLPHTRAWELLVGAVLAVQLVPGLQQRWLRSAVATAGLAAILFSIKFFNQGLPFPGASALVPVLGAAAIIAAGTGGNSWVGQLLSLPPMVFIGKISFSLYLWHWPVMVFSRTFGLLEQTPWAKIVEVAVSMLLAVASWWWVERPFRSGLATVSTRKVLGTGLTIVGAFCAVGAWAAQSDGMPWRLSASQRALASYLSYQGDARFRGGSCFVVDPRNEQFDDAKCLKKADGKPSVLLLGDSHAAHLWPGLARHAGEWNVLQATHTGCRPVLTNHVGACDDLIRRVISSWLPANHVEAVILAGRWAKEDLDYLAQTIQHIRPYARVIVVGPVPQYVAALPSLLARYQGEPARIQDARIRRLDVLDDQLRAVAKGGGAHYFSLKDGLCSAAGCRVLAAPECLCNSTMGTSHLKVLKSQSTRSGTLKSRAF